jgi:hypothetical protein
MDIEELADALARVLGTFPEVGFAYLHGSRARGTPRSDSDVDLAVWTGRADAQRQRGVRRRLSMALAEVIPAAWLDLVFLETAPVTLAYEVLRSGLLLSCRDQDARAVFFVRTLAQYFDQAPMRELHWQGLRGRIQGGEGVWSLNKSSAAG